MPRQKCRERTASSSSSCSAVKARWSTLRCGVGTRASAATMRWCTTSRNRLSTRCRRGFRLSRRMSSTARRFPSAATGALTTRQPAVRGTVTSRTPSAYRARRTPPSTWSRRYKTSAVNTSASRVCGGLRRTSLRTWSRSAPSPSTAVAGLLPPRSASSIAD